MANERDTHFANAAKLLLDRLMNKFDHLPPGQWGPAESDELIIAQFAYDLSRHIIWETMGGTPNAITIILADVPDLTAWPDTSPPS